jgi:hypothetical protein
MVKIDEYSEKKKKQSRLASSAKKLEISLDYSNFIPYFAAKNEILFLVSAVKPLSNIKNEFRTKIEKKEEKKVVSYQW